MTDFSSTLAGIRQAIVDDGAVGRSVWRATATDDPKPPCVIITDAIAPVAGLSGDGGMLEQARPLDVEVLQKNARDADPRLASRVLRAVHGARFTVDGAPTRLRAAPIEDAGEEGYFVQRFSVTAYQAAFTP